LWYNINPMQDIKDLNLRELEELLRSWRSNSYHAKQIFSWVYKKGARNFDQMSDLPLDLRKRLKERLYLFGFNLVKLLSSRDGTEKFLFALKDKNFIEVVSIPTEERITGCISTQAGCKFGCYFCASGILGFKRNLTRGEILEEVLYLKNDSKVKKITHLVFMGTGEPLDNYDHVLGAIRIINSPYAFNIGARRITISTCGIIPAIKKLSKEGLQIELSISLHAADDKTRSRLLPINKKYPLLDLMAACREYIKNTDRQITFEYVLIKNINSALPDARNLSKIIRGLNCKVNLIPCNTIEEQKVEPPNKLETLLFRDYLLKAGVNVTLRRPRGQDIEAACGQLRVRHEKK